MLRLECTLLYSVDSGGVALCRCADFQHTAKQASITLRFQAHPGYSYFYVSRNNFAKISSRERYVFLFFVFLFAIVLALAFFLEMASSHEKIFI